MLDFGLTTDESAMILESTVKLGLAVILAGALGLERERKGRAAGLRTHILVCLGATLAMIVSDLIAREAGAADPLWRLDAGRIAAGIITGVGFLGAGTIINTGNTQVGLTTAAMIWFSATLGIAIGAGFYLLATVATIVALIVVLGFSIIGPRVQAPNRCSLRIHTGYRRVSSEAIAAEIRRAGYSVETSRLAFGAKKGKVEMEFELLAPPHHKIEDLVELLGERFDELEEVIVEG